MRALIVGGAGFIGSNIARATLRKGWDVRILDNFSTGSPRNLPGLDAELVHGDVMNEEVVNKAMRDVDYVFHQAAISSSPMFSLDPRLGIAVNIQGFLNVLHAAGAHNVKKVVYAMTSTMYGNVPGPWKEEDASPERCPNIYAYSLLARSHFCRLYRLSHNIDTVGTVYFSVYGPNEEAKGKYANVISQFLWRMIRGKRPILYGDGTQGRDFIYVSDVAKANLLAAESSLSGGFVNIGTGRETSMKSIIELLNKMLGTNLDPIYAPNPIQGYVYHSLADVSQATREIGFRAEVSVKEGLRRLVNYYVKPCSAYQPSKRRLDRIEEVEP